MSVLAELEKLADMRDRGLLSPEEFASLKARLVAGGASGLVVGGFFGSYKILGQVGDGGMGAVYRARHRHEGVAQQQGGDVAIKVLHPQHVSDEDHVARFFAEAEIGMRLRHPSLLRVFETMVEGDRVALVMAWAEGAPLADQMGTKVGPLPWFRISSLVTQMLDGIGYAHAQGVVHRDLKPDNIMVAPDGTVRILDFGIAKSTSDRRTKVGLGMGTIDYMAPEQYVAASDVDARCDIYAMGIILYEMLAGRLPWAADAGEFQVLDAKRRGFIVPPTVFYPDIPPWVAEAVMRCVEVESGRRPASVEALREGLWNTAKRASAAAMAGGPAVAVALAQPPAPGRTSMPPSAPSAPGRTSMPPPAPSAPSAPSSGLGSPPPPLTLAPPPLTLAPPPLTLPPPPAVASGGSPTSVGATDGGAAADGHAAEAETSRRPLAAVARRDLSAGAPPRGAMTLPLPVATAPTALQAGASAAAGGDASDVWESRYAAEASSPGMTSNFFVWAGVSLAAVALLVVAVLPSGGPPDAKPPASKAMAGGEPSTRPAQADARVAEGERPTAEPAGGVRAGGVADRPSVPLKAPSQERGPGGTYAPLEAPSVAESSPRAPASAPVPAPSPPIARAATAPSPTLAAPPPPPAPPAGPRNSAVYAGAAPAAPAAPRPAPPPNARVAGTSSGGQATLDTSAIERAVDAKMPAITDCYEQALESDPSLAGRLVVRFVVSAEGTVTSASGAGVSPAVDLCVQQQFRRMTFPASAGRSPTSLTYTLNFSSN
jgi:serine/threonine-protein kinase